MDISSIRKWTARGSLAVLDQALFSGANFIVNILLARWLPPEEYGAFAVAMSIFYLLAGFHTAVVTEPMMVFGAGKYKEHFKKYLGILIWGHWAISGLIALFLGISAMFFIKRGSPMGEALLGLAIASPFLLLLWLTRRACYTNFKQGWAIEASIINLLVTLLGIILLWKAGLLSTLTGIVALGVAAGVASLLLTSFHLRPKVIGYSGNPGPSMIIKDHWGFGLWSIMAVTAYWISGQILILILPMILGLKAAGIIAAVWNFYRPVNLVIQTLGLMLISAVSRWVHEDIDIKQANKNVYIYTFYVWLGILLYTILLSIFSTKILNAFYGGSYNIDGKTILLFGMSFAFSSTTSILNMALKAYGKIKLVFFIWIISSFVLILFSFPMVSIAGIEGALFAAMFSYLISTINSHLALKRMILSNRLT